MDSKDPKEAILQYSVALSLTPQNPAGLLVKRSKARGMLGLWEDALKDADEVCLFFVPSRLATLNFTAPGNQGRASESVGVRDKACGAARFATLR